MIFLFLDNVRASYPPQIDDYLYTFPQKCTFQHLCDSCGAQHPLQVTPDPPDVPMGEASLHPPAAETPGYEETHQNSQQRVSSVCSI